MATYNAYFLTILATAFLVSLTVEGGKVKKAPTCRGQTVNITQDGLDNVEECMKEVLEQLNNGTYNPQKISKGIPKEKMACLGKCILEKEGLINRDTGKVSKETLMGKIMISLPQDVAKDMGEAVEKCVDKEGDKVKPKDETCMSYQGLVECMNVAFVEVCAKKE